MARRGIFITFEGGEGSGKSTQIQLLHAALEKAGIDALRTREPGGTPQAERIRSILVQRDAGKLDPLTEALLLFAGRREHVVNLIFPALEKGQWVVCDRFADSTRAMQGNGLGLPQDIIENLYKMTVGDVRPDLTFILDIDPKNGLKRSAKRLEAQASTEDRYERMDLGFHERLRQGFLDIAKSEPGRCTVISAEQPPEAIHREILKTVSARFSVSFSAPELKHG